MSPSKKTKGVLAIIGGIMLIVIGSLLSSCTTETVVREVPVTAAPDPDPAPLSQSDLEEVVWDTVVDEMGYKYDRQIVMDVAYGTCESLRGGSSIEDIFYMILATDPDPEFQIDAAFIVGAGVGAFCPEYQRDLEEFVASFN